MNSVYVLEGLTHLPLALNNGLMQPRAGCVPSRLSLAHQDADESH